MFEPAARDKLIAIQLRGIMSKFEYCNLITIYNTLIHKRMRNNDLFLSLAEDYFEFRTFYRLSEVYLNFARKWAVHTYLRLSCSVSFSTELTANPIAKHDFFSVKSKKSSLLTEYGNCNSSFYIRRKTGVVWNYRHVCWILWSFCFYL